MLNGACCCGKTWASENDPWRHPARTRRSLCDRSYVASADLQSRYKYLPERHDCVQRILDMLAQRPGHGPNTCHPRHSPFEVKNAASRPLSMRRTGARTRSRPEHRGCPTHDSNLDVSRALSGTDLHEIVSCPIEEAPVASNGTRTPLPMQHLQHSARFHVQPVPHLPIM